MKKSFAKSKPRYLIGIDEVGRGPIAGPVTVGAFCVSAKDLPRVKKIFRGVKESKQLSEHQRERWFEVIQQAKKLRFVDFAVTFQSEKVIDGKGLSYAIKDALETSLGHILEGVSEVRSRQVRILLDGGLKAPPEFTDQKTIIKGDEKEMIIALASICAKVLRDRKMNRLSKKHPAYGFELHKGYGTPKHYEAIKKYGLLPAHRRLFLRSFLGKSKTK